MRSIKKAAALTVAVIILLSGCVNSAEKATELMQQAGESLQAVNGLNSEMTLEVIMETGGRDFANKTVAEITSFTEPAQMKIDVSSNLKQSEELSPTMCMYTKQADEKLIAYTNMGTGWYADTISDREIGQYNAKGNGILFLNNIEEAKPVDRENWDGLKITKIEGVLTGETAQEIVQAAGMDSTIRAMGVSEAELVEIYSQAEPLPLSLWVGEDGALYAYEIDMTAIVQTIVNKAMNLLGMDETDLANRVTIIKTSIHMSFEYPQQASAFDIPSDVLETEILND